MAIARHFLNCQQPALQSAADYLLGKYTRASCLDLDRVIVVTNGSRAGRNLDALLLVAVEKRGLTYFPPELATVGRLPERLYGAYRPFASEWVQQVAWADAVRTADENTRLCVFPHSRTSTAKSEESSEEEEWLGLGRLLQAAYRELAAAGLSFSDVVERTRGMHEFPDTVRWQAMAVMQEGYVRRLAAAGMCDRQTARLEAIRRRACACERDIVLVATADLNHAVRQMLDQVTERVTTLVHAPEEWADRFHTCGSVVTDAWQTTAIPIDDGQIMIVDQYADQAEAVITRLADVGEQYTSDEIAIGCPDQGLVPHLERAFAEVGLNARWGPGRSLVASGPYQLLATFRQVIATERFDALAALLRHPDIANWLHCREVPDDWEAYLDEYRNAHLPLRIPQVWLGRQDRYEPLVQATAAVAGLYRPFLQATRPLAQWAQRMGELLAKIYASADWSQPGQRRTALTCDLMRRALEEFARTPAEFDRAITADRALKLLLEQIAGETLPDDPDADAIELLGWLELPLELAPLLIITGLAEGIVPQSNRSDMFLPDRLRKHLNLEDNEHRYARDAYALSVLLRAHPGLSLIVSRHDATGDPLKPSRLLFADSPDVITRRWLRMLDPDTPINGHAPDTIRLSETGTPCDDPPAFGFAIPRPQPLPAPVTRMRITDFKSYLACPYRYYLQRQLGLGGVDEMELEMDGGLFGTIIHDVLNDFGRGEARDSSDAELIASDLRSHLDRHLRHRFGRDIPPALVVQEEQMRLRLEAFASCQASRRLDGWRIAHVEEPRECVARIKVKEGTIELSGRIDRIDRHDESGHFAILDYKTSDTGATPESVHRKGPTSRKRWIDLQLPLYRHIAEAMGIALIDEVGYVLLPKKLADVRFCAADWEESDYQEAMRTAEQVVGCVLRQEFWPPGEPMFAPGDEFAGILMIGVPERPTWDDGAK